MTRRIALAATVAAVVAVQRRTITHLTATVLRLADDNRHLARSNAALVGCNRELSNDLDEADSDIRQAAATIEALQLELADCRRTRDLEPMLGAGYSDAVYDMAADDTAGVPRARWAS